MHRRTYIARVLRSNVSPLYAMQQVVLKLDNGLAVFHHVATTFYLSTLNHLRSRDKGMSICSICDSGRPRPYNPSLCNDCQDWDDLQHVASCRTKQAQFAPLDPLLFSYKHNPWWPPAQKNNYAELKDLEFRELHDFASARACIMCATVREALQALHSAETKCKIAVWKPFVHDPCDEHRAMPEEVSAQSGKLPTLQRVVLAVVVATSPRSQDDWIFEPRVLHLKLLYERWCHGLSTVSLWQRSTINYQQVERWLSRCTLEHGPGCNALQTPQDMKLPSSFRLVDTYEWCVARVPEPDSYVALSYVWSLASDSSEKQQLQLQQDNVGLLEAARGLQRDKLPEVIVDAIQLCAELGQRYLWIDRLCIVQDDADTKAEQLDAMGLVYHRAFLTIVALGDGVTRGLPGISSRPRPATLVNHSWDLLATMRNPMGIAMIPWIELAVQKSKWNDRAWTFQEKYLSRRALYFDEGQVYGNCCRERWCDNADRYEEEAWKKSPHWEEEGLGNRLHDDMQDSLEEYIAPLRSYSPRSLTFQHDILNAFAGVGSILRKRLETKVLCGHPERFFLPSLLWIPCDDGGRKRSVPGVPSWSWASCMDGVDWTDEWAIGETFLAGTTGARAAVVDFHVADPSVGLRRICHADMPLSRLRKQCRWWALMVIKQTDPQWWPASLAQEDRPASVQDDAVDHVVSQCMEAVARQGGTLSNEHPMPRTRALEDVSSEERMQTAFRVLKEHESAYWWPPLMTGDPREKEELLRLSPSASLLASGFPNALVFNTSVARLRLKPFGFGWRFIPPRRFRTGCYITTQDENHVGITMRMSPWLVNDICSGQLEKEYSVLVIGVGAAERQLRQTDGRGASAKLCQWYEWNLLVMVADEDDRGVCRRVAIGVVYPDMWAKVETEWRTVVVG